jgi:TatA/E family protein of Tat protein translocase
VYFNAYRGADGIFSERGAGSMSQPHGWPGFRLRYALTSLDRAPIINPRVALFSGGIEIGFLLFLAYLLFGPKKLPEIARTLGKGMAELRRASNELKRSLEEEITNLDRYSENNNRYSETANRSENVIGPTPSYGDHHSEPAPTESQSRS